MTDMKRRTFLKALGGIAAVAVVPATWLQSKMSRSVIEEGGTLYFKAGTYHLSAEGEINPAPVKYGRSPSEDVEIWSEDLAWAPITDSQFAILRAAAAKKRA